MKRFVTFVEEIIMADIQLGKAYTLPFSLFTLVLSFLLPTLLGLVLYHLIKTALQKLLSRSKLKESSQNSILRWVKILLKLIYIAVVLILGTNLFGAELISTLGIIGTVLTTSLIGSGDSSISIITLLLAIPVFYIASGAAKAVRTFVKVTFFDRIPNLDESKKFTALTLIRYLVMILIVLVGLSVIGIDLTTITVLLGVLGIGIGFGLQNMVNNLIAGLIIIFSRPIKEGDRIIVGAIEGTVIQIKLMATIVNTLANETIIVPNNELVNNSVHNYSFNDRKVVIKNRISVDYNSDMDHVLAVIRDVASHNPFRISAIKPTCRIEEFGDSGVEIIVFTWIRDVGNKYEAYGWNNLEIWRTFKAEGIQIPYPHLDLHIRSRIKAAPDQD